MGEKRLLKVLRTWDHSTNWIENVPGAQEYGVANYYAKDPDWFATDYETAVDWCAKEGIDAICIAGFLRDRHVDFWMDGYPDRDAGLLAARRVCEYGRQKQVRVCLSAGLFTHGGIYFRGVSKWSLETFLKNHPEARRRDAGGQPVVRRFAPPLGTFALSEGNPDSSELRQYALDAVAWAFSSIPGLGGFHFLDDPHGLQGEIARIVRAQDPEALVLGDPAGGGVLDIRHTDAGSQWGEGRDVLAVEAVRAVCRSALTAGADGVSMWGEVSPHRANAEFSYLALSFFGTAPDRTMDAFVREVMAPRLGGLAMAERYLDLAGLRNCPRKIPAAVREITCLAASQDAYETVGRWYSLAESLQARCWAAEEEAGT